MRLRRISSAIPEWEEYEKAKKVFDE